VAVQVVQAEVVQLSAAPEPFRKRHLAVPVRVESREPRRQAVREAGAGLRVFLFLAVCTGSQNSQDLFRGSEAVVIQVVEAELLPRLAGPEPCRKRHLALLVRVELFEPLRQNLRRGVRGAVLRRAGGEDQNRGGQESKHTGSELTPEKPP